MSKKPDTGEYIAKAVLTGGAVGAIGLIAGVSSTVMLPFGLAAWYLMDKNERKDR